MKSPEYSAGDDMSPEASPNVRGVRAGVRRVNNIPLVIAGVVVSVFLAIMVVVAADRATPRIGKVEEQNEMTVSNSAVSAQEVIGDHLTGFIPAETSLPNRLVVPIARSDDSLSPPLPGDVRPLSPLPHSRPPSLPANADAAFSERVRARKLEQFEAALAAKTSVPSGIPRNAVSPIRVDRDAQLGQLSEVQRRITASPSQDATVAYQARLAQLRRQVENDGTMPTSPQLRTGSSSRDPGTRQVGEGGPTDRWRLNATLKSPRTPYELRAGFVIPATMISGINSDLPGQIIAQVSHNIYDTPTGKHLLVPLGTRLVGAYASDIAYGQERVMISWQRLVFPDGKAMDIGSMPGTDGAGYSGFEDQVNHHFWRMFGSAILMSFITAGVELSQSDGDDGNRQRASDALSESLGQQLGSTMSQMITKNLNIAPTIEIRPGYRFNVMVNKDVTFTSPYRAFAE